MFSNLPGFHGLFLSTLYGGALRFLNSKLLLHLHASCIFMYLQLVLIVATRKCQVETKFCNQIFLVEHLMLVLDDRGENENNVRQDHLPLQGHFADYIPRCCIKRDNAIWSSIYDGSLLLAFIYCVLSTTQVPLLNFGDLYDVVVAWLSKLSLLLPALLVRFGKIGLPSNFARRLGIMLSPLTPLTHTSVWSRVLSIDVEHGIKIWSVLIVIAQ